MHSKDNFIKPQLNFFSFPKKKVYLAVLLLLLGSISFSFLFQGLFFAFYSSLFFIEEVQHVKNTLSLNHLFIFNLFLSLESVLLASIFANKMLFSGLKNKSFKQKTSFISHTFHDVTWSFIFFINKLLLTIFLYCILV
jgi:hypothetical protein